MQGVDQGMPSRAYGATCSFRDSKPPLSESRTADYMKEREKVLGEIDAQATVLDEVRRNMIVSGGFPQAKVEEKLGSVGKLPDDLIKAWVEMQRSAVKFRLSQDEDYEELRNDNAPNPAGMTANLKKL